jgi:fucose 4-O-acetylase-like acetyltransferase
MDFVGGFLCYDEMALDARLPYGIGINPPSITLSILALIVLGWSCGVFSLLEYSKHLCWITNFSSWIGKNTLYIFLYHLLFLSLSSKYFIIDNMWIKRTVYLCSMIFGPILLEYIFKWIKNQYAKIYFK